MQNVIKNGGLNNNGVHLTAKQLRKLARRQERERQEAAAKTVQQQTVSNPVSDAVESALQPDSGGVAVMEELVPPPVETEPTESETPQAPQEPPAANPIADLTALVGGSGRIEYTREQLLDARTYTLLVKRSARLGGFGEKVGPMIRNTLGYKFDSMDIMDMLKNMAQADFLDRYKATTERWFAGLNKSATDATLKVNAARFAAAMALFTDPTAYTKLVKSLLILCQRNQSWMESGDNVALPYNGHKAVLDLFGINVTNSRRLKLTAV